MKNIKKLFGLLFAFVIALVQVNAAGNGSITINKAVVDETYSIYRVLDLETYDETNNHYIYRANANFKAFIESAEGQKYLVAKNENGATYYVWKTGADVVEFSKVALAWANSNNVNPVDSKKATSTTVKFDNLPLGYYLVDTTTGSLLNLTTTNPNAVIEEKNTVTPKVDKDVKEDSTGAYGKTNDATIGDTIEFKATIITGAGYTDYKLRDKMSAGLTFNANSVVVKVNNTVVDSSNYTVRTDVSGYTFVIEFKNEYIVALPKNTIITVTYSAILNENAIVEGEGNPNVLDLAYGDTNTPEKQTITYSYAFDVIKIDGKERTQLTGAEFRLYDAKTGGNEIKVVLVDATSNTYRVARANENGVTIKAGKATILGLDAGTYYLEEVVAPTGYNKLTSRVEIIISKINSDKTFSRFSTNVENYTGSKLPETGGIGTTLFLTLGSILVIGFGLLLVTKLRVYKENI